MILGTLLVVVVLGSFPLKWTMDRRARYSALEQSKKSVENGDFNLAIRHLNRFLEDYSPNDIPVLEAKAKLLAEASRSSKSWLLEAAKVHDQLIRLDPTGADRLETRRKLADLYIQYSDLARRSLIVGGDSNEEVREFRYQAAVAIVQELLRIEAESTPPIEDSVAHRLLAMGYMGQVPHVSVKSNKDENIPELLKKAKFEFSEALRIDPKDVTASEKLAELYLTQLNDPAAAEKTLDSMIAAMPDAVEARLSRYRAYMRSKKFDEATSELDAAIAVATKDAPLQLQLRLQAATDALGRKKTAVARGHLEAIPPSVQNEDLRVKVLRGQLDFAEQHPDEAIDQWRQGLSLVSGTHVDLTWHLAFSMIRLGGPRLKNAEALINQYFRLSNDDKDGKGLFLRAMYDQRTGHPSEAIKGLEKVVKQIPPDLLPDALMALGSCYESIGEEEKAILAYTNAVKASPGSSIPRRAIARIHLAKNPQQAIADLERSLKILPDDAGLLFDLIRIQLGQQLRLPIGQRRWDEVEDLFRRADLAKRGVVEDANYRGLYAEYLTGSNKIDAAVRLLTEATKNADRKLPMTWITLASLLERQSRRADAIKILDQGLAADAAGDRVSLRIAKAQLLFNDGKGQAAREVLSKDHSSLQTSERPELYRTMGNLLRSLGDREGARASYVEWARLAPESTEPAQTLLNFAEAYGDDEAAKLGLDALRSVRKADDPYALVAQALELLRVDRSRPGPPPPDRLARAENLVAELNKIAPALSWRALLEGRIREYRGNLREAAVWYRKANANSKGGPALPRLIEVYMKLHDDAQLALLESEYDEASKQSPNLSREFSQISLELARKLDDKDRVQHYASKLLDGQADSVQVATEQARLLIAVGKIPEAELKLRQLVTSRPQEPAAWFALIKFQAVQRTPADVVKVIDEAKEKYRAERPELFLAQCYWIGEDNATAARLFEVAKAKAPEDLITLRGFVDFCGTTGRDGQVEAPLRKALSIDPTASWAAKKLAMRLTSKSDPSAWNEAWNLVAPGSSAAGDTPEDRLVRAIVLARSQDSARRAEAIKAYTALIDDLPIASPLAVDARVMLSQAMLEIGRPVDAWTYIAPLAEDLSRFNPLVLSIGIEALTRLRKGDEAQKLLDRLIEQAPKSPQTPILKARVLFCKGKNLEASDLLKSAFGSAENSPEGESFGLSALDLMLQSGAVEGAYEIARKLASHWPRDAWGLARAQVARQETDQALSSCRIALEAGGLLEAREAMRQATSAALVRRSDPGFLKQVEAFGRAALAKSPDDYRIHVLMATVHHVEGHYEDEIACYTQALKLSPTSSDFLNNMAWTLSEGLGKHKEALERIEETIQRVGLTSDFLDTRGVIRGRLGKTKEAIADLELSIKANPLAATYFHLAQVQFKAGNLVESHRSRDLAWGAKFDPESLDPTDRTDLDQVMGKAKP